MVMEAEGTTRGEVRKKGKLGAYTKGGRGLVFLVLKHREGMNISNRKHKAGVTTTFRELTSSRFPMYPFYLFILFTDQPIKGEQLGGQ